MAQPVKHLLLAQVMILGSWDPVPSKASCLAENLLLPLPLLLPLLVLSLSLSNKQINKIFKKKNIWFGIPNLLFR